MPLTSQQEIPEKPKTNEPWSFKRLFPRTATALAKVFSSPLEVVLAYLIFMSGITEVTGQHISWRLWLLIVFLLLIVFIERSLAKSVTSKPKTDK